MLCPELWGEPMRRRDFVLAGGAAVVVARCARANSVQARHWVYVLAAFHKGLQDEGGFTDGENVTVEYRWACGNYAMLPTLAGELVARSVDVLVAVGGDASARAAKAATSKIPIVFTISGDPV